MTTLHQKLMLSFATVAALGCGTAWADPAATGCGSINGVQRRIVEHADQGMASLRGYVHTTTLIHSVDMAQVVESLDTWRAVAKCQEEVAAKASAQAPLAAAEPEAGIRTAGR